MIRIRTKKGNLVCAGGYVDYVNFSKTLRSAVQNNQDFAEFDGEDFSFLVRVSEINIIEFAEE